MNTESDFSRLELLFLVLCYCSEKGAFFSVGERICINQERALLMRNDAETSKYEQPQSICHKIDFVVRKIKETGYTPNEYLYELR